MSETKFKNILNRYRGQKKRARKQKIFEKEATAKEKEEYTQTSKLEWPDIMKASFAGDIKWLNTLLKDELDVNRQDSDGVTALMLASREGHTEVVKILIDKGAQVNLQKNSGESALMMASKRGHTEVVQLLLDHGAHVNMQSEKGDSALMMASVHGESDVVELLIQNKALVNMQAGGVFNWSALMMASRNGHTEVVKLLILKGADVGMRDSLQEEDALMQACRSGHLEVVKLLVEKGAQVDSRNKYNMTPLMIASACDSHEIVKYLLDKGATINTQMSDGFSTLMFASSNKDSQIAQLLIDKGAEVNMQDNKGNTALSIASQEKSTETVKHLLKNDAKVDHLSSDGFSPLMLTCNNDEPDIEIAELLLKNGAQIDLQNDNGLSSLMIAAQNQHNKLVLSLLQHGAFADVQDNHGLSPLMLASELGFGKMANLLIEYGAQLDLQDKDGKSALLHAVSSGCVDLASHLIELGAQVNLQDNSGWFPLMYAVKAGDLETVQILVAYGASIELKNCNGQTIFDVCPQYLINLPLFQELYQRLLNTVNDDLKIDPDYPGVVFHKAPISKRVTSSGATIDRLQDMGISISVPEGSLSPSEEPLDLHIHPCFRGSFRLPKTYKSVSPAYLIRHSKKTNFHKDITVRIHHYACLGSEEDCEEMTFLSASSTPEYIESHQDEGVVHPVYSFKKIRGANAKFRPGDQVGEISLRHFCILKIVRHKRSREEDEPSNRTEKKQRDHDQCMYSARLYRKEQEMSATFCICLLSPIYTKHCDQVIGGYTDMPKKSEISHVMAEIVEDGVTILSRSSNSGSVIRFDRNPPKILKRQIHFPEIIKMKVSQLLDYPPSIQMFVQNAPSEFNFDLPEVQIIGLDIECSLQVLTQPPMEVKGATVGGELKVAVSSTLNTPPVQVTPSPGAVSLATSPDARANQELKSQSPEWKCDLAALDVNPLERDDLGDVLDAVEPLSSEWRRLCTKLRLKETSLDLIESNNPLNMGACLHKALGEWLKLNYDHQRHGRPSWRRLAEAVSSLDYALSEKIAKTHCQ